MGGNTVKHIRGKVRHLRLEHGLGAESMCCASKKT